MSHPKFLAAMRRDRIPMALYLLLLAGAFTAPALRAQAPSPSPAPLQLRQVMSLEEIKAAGLHKLTPTELRQLETAMNRIIGNATKGTATDTSGPAATTPANPGGNRAAPKPLAHFRFDGNARNEVPGGSDFAVKYTEFRGNAIYLNGIYGYTPETCGYRAVCATPDLDYDHFSVGIRFKAEDFDDRKTNILTGGTGYRWFGISRMRNGNLDITLNNQNLHHEVKSAPLKAGEWTVVACSVDIPARKVTVFFNGKKADAFDLPNDFELEVKKTSDPGSYKNWTFSNFSIGTVFHGLVDDCIMYNGALTDEHLARIPPVLPPNAVARGAASTPRPTPRPPEKSLGGVLGHYRFNGNANDENSKSPPFSLTNTEFRDGALYLNGLYGKGAYRAECMTPKLAYDKFTVAVRLKSESFDENKDNLFTGGLYYRWFGMRRNRNGNLSICFNNWQFGHEVKNASIAEGAWVVIACGVDLSARKVSVFFNGKKADAFDLPKNFALDVLDADARTRDRERSWTFTNTASGGTFQGLIDECIIYGDMLSDEELAKIPLTP